MFLKNPVGNPAVGQTERKKMTETTEILTAEEFRKAVRFFDLEEASVALAHHGNSLWNGTVEIGAHTFTVEVCKCHGLDAAWTVALPETDARFPVYKTFEGAAKAAARAAIKAAARIERHA